MLPQDPADFYFAEAPRDELRVEAGESREDNWEAPETSGEET